MTRSPARALGYAPWSARAWRDTAFAAAGVGPAFAVPFAMVCAIPYAAYAVFAVPLVFPALAALSRVQRSRFRSLLGLEVPLFAYDLPWYTWRGGHRRLRDEATWRRAAIDASSGSGSVSVGYP